MRCRRSPAHGGRYGGNVARKAGPVGRADVLDGLRRVVDQAVAGRGQIMLLAGEAGIGKTTMLAAAADYAESRGARVAWGWGWPGEGAPGYWPWVQVMRALGLDIPWPAEPSGQAVRDAPASERFRLFDEVTSLLLAESRIQPLLVLLDDLQWAGRPSQLLLDFLGRRLPAGAVAVVGSYRDVEPAPGPVLAALAARTTVLPLTGLSPDAVTGLVAELLADAVADGLGGSRPLAGALARYHRARDRATRPMYDFTARLAEVNPPTPAEMALFRALACRQEDSDMFLGVLAGSIPLRQLMSPRTMVRLVGAGGFARLMLGQARPHRAVAARPGPHVIGAGRTEARPAPISPPSA